MEICTARLEPSATALTQQNKSWLSARAPSYMLLNLALANLPVVSTVKFFTFLAVRVAITVSVSSCELGAQKFIDIDSPMNSRSTPAC